MSFKDCYGVDSKLFCLLKNNVSTQNLNNSYSGAYFLTLFCGDDCWWDWMVKQCLKLFSYLFFLLHFKYNNCNTALHIETLCNTMYVTLQVLSQRCHILKCSSNKAGGIKMKQLWNGYRFIL